MVKILVAYEDVLRVNAADRRTAVHATDTVCCRTIQGPQWDPNLEYNRVLANVEIATHSPDILERRKLGVNTRTPIQ